MPDVPLSDWPIVVGGCHRSGTSLVRRLLNSHSRIHCGPEVKLFADLYDTGARDPWRLHFVSTAGSLLSSDELLALLGPVLIELHERAAAAAGKVRWADKVPENVVYLPQWHRLLGDRWLFVHVIRNPLDTIASLREAPFIDTPKDLTAQIVHYRNYVEAGLRFEAEQPDRCQAVVYEQLVSQPEATLAALMSFLGETPEEQQLAFNEQPHEVGVEDYKIAATTEIHQRSAHRWPSVLSGADAELVWDLTADLWAQIDAEGRFATAPSDG